VFTAPKLLTNRPYNSSNYGIINHLKNNKALRITT